VCLGLPGALPVANARAVQDALLIGLALGCELAPRSIFHRKNYFYPTCPRATRSASTTSRCAAADISGTCGSTRVHMEDDGRQARARREVRADPRVQRQRRRLQPRRYAAGRDRHGADVRSAEQAREWLELLQVTLRRLGVSDVRMEEGSLRADANVSVRPVAARSWARRPS